MILVGMPDSPYVRRVAVSLKRMEIPFEHQQVSVFRHFDRFKAINPVVKAPSFVCDDGTVLMDSSLILDHEQRPADKRHMPWMERVIGQANAAYGELERAAAARRGAWLQDESPNAADIAVACAWRFGQYYNQVEVPAAGYPALVAHSRRAEALPEFASTPLD
jgi:glutathione S-transferase